MTPEQKQLKDIFVLAIKNKDKKALSRKDQKYLYDVIITLSEAMEELGVTITPVSSLAIIKDSKEK